MQTAKDIFNTYALEYQDKYMDVGLYGDSFDYFCDQLKIGADILDVACGPGNISRYLLNRRPDFRLLGIDLAPKMIELAQNNNPEAVFKVMDGRNIGQLEQKFDAILCGFCLPYLSGAESLKLIQDASNLLNEGGVFYISTMEGDYSTSGLQKNSKGDMLYQYFYEADCTGRQQVWPDLSGSQSIRAQCGQADHRSHPHCEKKNRAFLKNGEKSYPQPTSIIP